MEVVTSKGVQDPKGYAMAHHECDISLLLPVWYGVKLIAWGILWVCTYFHVYIYVIIYAKQKQPGCKKVRGQSEATMVIGDQKL